VFGEFTTALDFEEVCSCLLEETPWLFGVYLELGGVLCSEEHSGRYLFHYAGRSDASRPMELSSGLFLSGAPCLSPWTGSHQAGK
jgi:hypothetical protein